MMTYRKLGDYVAAEPYRPFRIRMASGQSFEIRHPEMILVGRTSARVYAPAGLDTEKPDNWHDVSLMLMETLEPVDTPLLDPQRTALASAQGESTEKRMMITSTLLSSYVKAQPFRPFRLQMAGGKTYDILHPEMIKVLKNYVIVFWFDPGETEVFDRMESVFLPLIESISHLDAAGGI